jgi:ribose transport system permease protein
MSVTGISGLQIIGAQNYVQQLFYGISLILAVLLAKRRRNRGEVQGSGAIG